MTLCLQVCLLAACSKEFSDPTGVQDDNYLEISFSRATRADLDANGAGNFSEGDRIGLYIDNGSETVYRELTYTSGEWQPRLRRSDFGSGELTLAAHHPARSDAADDPAHAAITIADNQDAGGFTASGLLFARQVIPTGSYRAAMTFTHALHRLQIRFEGERVSDLRIRSRMDGTVDLLTGKTSVTDGSFGWISPRRNSDGSYEAVIFPQTADAYRSEDGLLQITTAEREIVYKAPDLINGQDLERFEAGKQLTIKLNLTSQGDLEWANRKIWVYGIQAPEEGAWIKPFSQAISNYYLPWKEEYGWYDCNKLVPEAGGVDCNMCWAASASNLMHWWISRNRSYIDRYGKYQGPDDSYKPREKESEIFTCFKRAFLNEAGYTDAGVNWFIHGTTNDLPYWNHYNEGGYFKDVFPEGVRLCSNIGGLGKERFNETIKNALANNMALALSNGPVLHSHAETIWGVEFDGNGDVSAIYLVDNNDLDQFEANGIGCGRFEVTYEKLQEGATYTCYKSGFIANNYSITINRLFVLSLGQEYWEQYFEKQASQAGA